MAHTVRTGGFKEFHYTDEDLQRIESDSHNTTKEAREAIRLWHAEIIQKKILEAERKNKKNIWKKILKLFAK